MCFSFGWYSSDVLASLKFKLAGLDDVKVALNGIVNERVQLYHNEIFKGLNC